MLDAIQVTLAVVIGMLAAIIYSLRILVLLERRIARMDLNIEKIAIKMVQEELKIERSLLSKSAKKSSKKKK
ncbi:hypothetical protein J4460_00535 [Candidatus Woesearchaeota archaeon]|nr:MAG: hypothetical protein QS99_C0002G0080 [archaeon GW2011_AR4]MBS3129137.1 hypothetical protein [Candidatus Woesearchaeota archaeon]HIH37870.1 hypothetical protein [Candidatus Woesearchaeota archaeon]HIH48843.1 hypothetical protein [Candidatus Woesearchaeota archaeon]HIJ03997.1 hypothetical protein [Candidatus Woesearchaeota archaeon]